MSTISRLSRTYGTSFMILVVLGYFTVGLRCFPWLAMTYWFKDTLKVDPGMMQFLMSSAALPMIAKPVYGIISDSVYIQGAHRVPYLVIAGLLQLLAWGAIAVHPRASSTATILTGFLTITNLGGAISEVVNDAMVAEAGKNKKGAQQGELQSFAWLALASGGVVGNLSAGYAMKILSPQAMLGIFISLIGAQLVLALMVKEQSFGLAHVKEDTDDNPESKKVEGKKDIASSLREQISTLKELLQKPEMFKPLLWFLSSYAVIPGLGSSLFFYQTQHLGLGASVVGLAKVVGQVGLLLGSMLYNKSLKGVPIRKLFGTVQILLSVCMLSDILLVKRINLDFGIPDKWFVLGASAFVEAIGQFKILPFMVLLAQLCPPGSEGSLFAFFMSAQCLAGLTNGYLGVALASYLNISATDFTGLPLGIFIQSLFALLPVLWIGFIPGGRQVTKQGQQEEIEVKKEL